MRKIGLKYVLLHLETGVMKNKRQLSGIFLFTKHLLDKVIAPASSSTRRGGSSGPEGELGQLIPLLGRQV